MEDITTIVIIKKQFVVEPFQLISYKKFLQNEVNKLAGKCVGEYGYIYEINKIISVEQENVHTQSFTGCLIFSVSFEATVINPEIGSHIKMQIIKNNDLYLAKKGPLICIITNGSRMDIDIGDTIDVVILIKEYNYGANIIKMVGECLI